MSDLSTGLMFVNPPSKPTSMNVLAYGPSGCGKSTLAATAPGPILWINLEGPGALSYARKTAATRKTEILEVQIGHDVDPRNTLRDAVRYCRDATNPQVATVVIDTLGKLRDSLARAIGGKQPTLPQWGEIGRTIEDVIRTFRDMPLNLIVIAHEEIKDSDDGDRIVRPLIGGQTTEKVVADMDLVAYLGVKRTEEGVEYLAQFVEDRGRRAKDRSGGLGTVQPSDFAVWFAAYQSALAPDESDVPWGEGYEPELDAAGVVDAGELADAEAAQA